jgi:hypothetical protein
VRCTAALVLILVTSASLPGRAWAESAPPRRARRAAPNLAVAFVAGAATALIPLALGAAHAATAVGDGQRSVGYAVGGAGLALSPIVAHVVLGEWQRAAAFGAAPVASEIAICSIMTAQPDYIFHGTVFSRTVFAVLFSIDVFGAAAGLWDVAMADDPKRPFAGKLTIAPTLGQGRFGITAGGTL